MNPFSSIGLIILGLLMKFRPEWFWKLEKILGFKEGQPNDTYLRTTKLGGVIFALAGVGMLIYTSIK